jgi:hypothetical protein
LALVVESVEEAAAVEQVWDQDMVLGVFDLGILGAFGQGFGGA